MRIPNLHLTTTNRQACKFLDSLLERVRGPVENNSVFARYILEVNHILKSHADELRPSSIDRTQQETIRHLHHNSADDS